MLTGPRPAIVLLAASMPLLAGCLGTVTDVVTAPVQVAGKAVDLATTSQSEADEKRGREIRQREVRIGKLDREYRHLRETCDDGERDACRKATKVRREIERLRDNY